MPGDGMTTIRLKDASIRLALSRRTLIVFSVILDAWERRAPGIDPVLTSANDGKHMATSKHYVDDAWDWRTFNLPRSTVDMIAEDLRHQLGPNYDVVIEKDHLHLEYDPTSTMT